LVNTWVMNSYKWRRKEGGGREERKRGGGGLIRCGNRGLKSGDAVTCIVFDRRRVGRGGGRRKKKEKKVGPKGRRSGDGKISCWLPGIVLFANAVLFARKKGKRGAGKGKKGEKKISWREGCRFVHSIVLLTARMLAWQEEEGGEKEGEPST